MENGWDRSGIRGRRAAGELLWFPQVRNDARWLQEGPCSGEESSDILQFSVYKVCCPTLVPCGPDCSLHPAGILSALAEERKASSEFSMPQIPTWLSLHIWGNHKRESEEKH